VSIAITIATSDDRAVQRALQEAYERNDLRGKALIRVRQLIDQRRARGKTSRRGPRPGAEQPVSAESVLRTLHRETARQKLVVQRAKIYETRLLFALSALRQLFRDDHFVTLLRAEGLDTLPAFLADRITPSEGTP
jgi:ParB family chromosome partitioning protein